MSRRRRQDVSLLRVTPIPPGDPAPWYSRARACVHCQARVLYRSEHATVVTITVQHESSCKVVARTSRGRDAGRAVQKVGRESRPLTAPLPLEGLR